MYKNLSHETAHPPISWDEGETTHSCRWRSEKGLPPPKKLIIADDTLTADEAYRVACEGTGIIWRGDFQNAKQLLQAMSRRADKPSKKSIRNQKSSKNKQTPSNYCKRCHAVQTSLPRKVFAIKSLLRISKKVLFLWLYRCQKYFTSIA